MFSLEGPGESSRARDLTWKPYSLFWYGDIHILDDPKPQTHDPELAAFYCPWEWGTDLPLSMALLNPFTNLTEGW